ncbi:hypothetical protein [Sediminimonas sp.]|uniref:hypothetical protein n=1 Tax=Sediminimonas sp. TaxID=2823379 RepID=UPI0025CE08DF|nr:hypothetical protein [Sediminimonas sp.]
MARSGLRRALTPRDAGILLVAGDMPGDAAEALGRVHDQLPHPRATLRWTVSHETADAVADRIVASWRDLGAIDEADLLPDQPPNEWKGVGPHGQGGKGMMGGTPYGRPMAMTGEDIRDGLQLDRYTARIGPFAPMLPPGLVLEVTLQGDVIVAATVQHPPFAQPVDADAPELCAARMLTILGLDGPARRAIHGRRPGGIWVRGAVPRGLGGIEGAGDARDRLAAFLGGDRAAVTAPDLSELLPGLEWSEAMLVMASLPPSAILRAARLPEAA